MCYTPLCFVLRHRKMSEPGSNPAFQLEPMCDILFILVRVLFIGLCRYTSYKEVIHRFPSGTDGNRCIPIPFLNPLYLFASYY